MTAAVAPSLVLLDVDAEGVATITLNRPDKHNAFTEPMIAEWAAALERCESDAAIKVIVLTGAGKSFCAGGDAGAQKERAESDSLERKHYLYRHVHRIAFLMERIDKPTIAAINGAARGAGMDMALMCDLRLMADSAHLAESYIDVGLIAGDGGAYYLPRLIGTARALELFWTGRKVDAVEAERIGLVNRVVPFAGLMRATQELARRIAAQPFEAVRAFKRAVYQGMHMTLGAHLDMVSSHVALLRDTPEHRTKVSEFLERKRKPQ